MDPQHRLWRETKICNSAPHGATAPGNTNKTCQGQPNYKEKSNANQNHQRRTYETRGQPTNKDQPRSGVELHEEEEHRHPAL